MLPDVGKNGNLERKRATNKPGKAVWQWIKKSGAKKSK